MLTACVAPPPVRDDALRQSAYEARAERLAAWADWSLTGRLGVDAGDEGGSGRLDWAESPGHTRLDFRGALGQGAWRLDVTPGEARLRRADGSEVSAGNVEQLVWRETGWNLPVTALSWWVRGVAWPLGATPATLELNDDGTPARMEQLGWRIDFTRYDPVNGLRLPVRLEAVREEVTVKLAISRWREDDEAASGPGVTRHATDSTTLDSDG